ncbi:hypothetical protein GQ457_14G001750 [Hibiscus cannabinus]
MNQRALELGASKGVKYGLYTVIVPGLDDCSLKGKFKGEILTPVGVDVNDQIYPVAWLLWNLKIDKYGIEEFFELLSRVKHRVCARHLYANWKMQIGRRKTLRKILGENKYGNYFPPMPRKMSRRPKRNRAREDGVTSCGTKLSRKERKMRC